MSKLFITNDVSILQHTISINQEFFPKYLTFTTEKCSAVFYEKKNYSLGNSFRDDAGNFIGIVGTYVYKECFGVEAARRILTDFDGDVVRMKKEVQGMFSAFIYKDGQVVVFNDYYGLYDTYYCCADDKYVIATSLKDLLMEEPEVEISEFPFVMDIAHTKCFDRDTSFRYVHKLIGTEYLSIHDGQVQTIDIPKQRYQFEVFPYKSIDELINYLIGRVTYYTTCVSENFERIALGMTGGLDSRTILASYLKGGNKKKITLLYGEGNSLLTATCKEDKNIVERLSRRFGIPIQYMNWRHSEVTTQFDLSCQQDLAKQYGFLNSLYCGNGNFFHEFEKKIVPDATFLDFGYFLEASRLREWAEQHKGKTFSLDEFVNVYYCNERLSTFYEHGDGFREYVRTLLAKRMDWGVDESKISIDSFERLRWNTARYSDSRLYQLLNCYTYTFPLFSVPDLHEYLLSLPADVTRDAQFQIRLLGTLNPSMLQIPVFSHRRQYYITKHGKKRMRCNAKNLMDIVLQRIPKFRAPIVNLYRHWKYEDYTSNWDHVQEQLDALMCDDIENFMHVKAYPKRGLVGPLYQLRQFLIVYHLVKNKER